MGFQDEMAEYIEDADEYLTEIEEDIRSFFAELDIVEQENMLLKDIDADARTYEWAPRTETSSAQKEARQKYEQWYNAVEPLVYQYLPRRYDEFEESRSKIIRYLSLKSRFWESPPEDPIQRAVEIVELLHGQQNIVKSTPSRVAAERFNARKEVSAHVEQDEIVRARRLFENNLIREGGVIAGVALERRLLTMCETSEKDIQYELTHGIDRLAQSLYEAGEIRNTPMKHLKRLGGIRGDCAHPDGEPNQEDVRRLIDDVEDIIREGFDK